MRAHVAHPSASRSAARLFVFTITLAACGGSRGGGVAVDPSTPGPVATHELLWGGEGNRLRRYDLDTVRRPPLVQDVFIPSDDDGTATPSDAILRPRAPAKDINGQICLLHDGSAFVAGEDTHQQHPPAGWGIFDRTGTQIGKLSATYYVEGPEPFGCVVDADGRLFTTEVGNQSFGHPQGQVILWFPPFDGFPGPAGAYPNTDERSSNYCKLATDLSTASNLAVDEQGRIYVTEAGAFTVRRYSPPFPTSPDAAGGCGKRDALGSPLADEVHEETFIRDPGHLLTPAGLARAPNGNWYVSSVFTGVIAEYDRDGQFVRDILNPGPLAILNLPIATGHPNGLAVDSQGDLYYADIRLAITAGGIDQQSGGGKIWRIGFVDGEPQPPQLLREGLDFPDAVSILPGDLEDTAADWPTLSGGPRRLFFNDFDDTWSANAILDERGGSRVREAWEHPTGAIVTNSPSIARIALPEEGVVPVVFQSSWDGNVYALRLADGRELWRFTTEPQPGATFPSAGSAHVENVDGETRVFVAGGETMYALDAVTGAERWRFHAGTGCLGVAGCGFDSERNEIESTPAFAEGKVFFGMDVNTDPLGKGGLYALDARDGRLAWFFDLESGQTCRPNADDTIRAFDGYHSEAELGLPAGFLATRAGCDFPRNRTGCEGIWSSAAVDLERRALFTASTNCYTDDDPTTSIPSPPMPPYDEALFAIDLDGNPLWRWRPREVDPSDLAFGAVPNLFSIDVAGTRREVVGIGNKDGTYYVLDRDGVNAVNGVAWNSGDPAALPYWATKVVPGGDNGGIIASAAVDPVSRRVYFSTAPGENGVSEIQRPTMHALDLDSGAIVWENTGEPDADASFAPVSATRGTVFAGTSVLAGLRIYDSASGERLERVELDNLGAASAPAIVDGRLVVGAGLGARDENPLELGEIASRTPSPIRAFCLAGTPGCAEGCDSALDRDGDSRGDACDRCPDAYDPSQRDDDGDGVGNVCDTTCSAFGEATTITRLSRASVSTGDVLTITGTGFGPSARVWFGAVEGGIVSVAPSALRVTVPEVFHADRVALRVVNPEGCASQEHPLVELER
ncbi:MAG: PQQ-binding-like beta-propeller repeat protein [bacterium]